ncbi:MAG: hypothetical protein ACOC9Z_03340 [Chloroflexota bacterium]
MRPAPDGREFPGNSPPPQKVATLAPLPTFPGSIDSNPDET